MFHLWGNFDHPKHPLGSRWFPKMLSHCRRRRRHHHHHPRRPGADLHSARHSRLIALYKTVSRRRNDEIEAEKATLK